MEVIIKDGIAPASGNIPNPGNYFYFRLAAATVRAVHSMRRKDGIRFARKAMIRTGLGLNINWQWE